MLLGRWINGTGNGPDGTRASTPAAAQIASIAAPALPPGEVTARSRAPAQPAPVYVAKKRRRQRIQLLLASLTGGLFYHFILKLGSLGSRSPHVEPPRKNDRDGAPPTQTKKFDELFASAYDRALGRGGGARVDEHLARRAYNISDFPTEYKTLGGLHDDYRTLLGEIYSSVDSAFEYGLGESTYIAAYTNMPRWSGIDSDSNWVAGVRDREIVPPHFQFSFGDIGPTGDWGYPKDGETDKTMLRYIMAPLALELEPFDVYLVDGRWRVACACVSFLHAMKTGGDMEKIRVLVHDYETGFRGYMSVIEEVAVAEKRLNWTAVFKLRPGTEESVIENLFLRSIDGPRSAYR